MGKLKDIVKWVEGSLWRSAISVFVASLILFVLGRLLLGHAISDEILNGFVVASLLALLAVIRYLGKSHNKR